MNSPLLVLSLPTCSDSLSLSTTERRSSTSSSESAEEEEEETYHFTRLLPSEHGADEARKKQKPADTSPPPQLGWCHHMNIQFSTNNFINILYFNTGFKLFIRT